MPQTGILLWAKHSATVFIGGDVVLAHLEIWNLGSQFLAADLNCAKTTALRYLTPHQTQGCSNCLRTANKAMAASRSCRDRVCVNTAKWGKGLLGRKVRPWRLAQLDINYFSTNRKTTPELSGCNCECNEPWRFRNRPSSSSSSTAFDVTIENCPHKWWLKSYIQ